LRPGRSPGAEPRGGHLVDEGPDAAVGQIVLAPGCAERQSVHPQRITTAVPSAIRRFERAAISVGPSPASRSMIAFARSPIAQGPSRIARRFLAVSDTEPARLFRWPFVDLFGCQVIANVHAGPNGADPRTKARELRAALARVLGETDMASFQRRCENDVLALRLDAGR
jgi:hypothetical protein